MKTITIPPGRIDHHLRTYRAPGTRFVLEPGDYTTQGAFAFAEHDLCMLAPGCELVGAGPDQTRLYLDDPVTTHGGKSTRYVEALTGGARTTGWSSSIRIAGLTVGCGSIDVMPSIGIHLWTSRAVVEDVCVDSVAGYRDWEGPVKEGFGILINNSAGLPVPHCSDGGHCVTQCEVIAWSHRSEVYATGIYIGAVRRGDLPMLWSDVLNCRVRAARLCRIHAGYAANSHTTIRGCEVQRAIRAAFCDTGPIEFLEIERMRAHDIQWALDLRVAEVGARREHIRISDSLFEFGKPANPGDWVQAVLLADESTSPGQTPIDDIELLGCRFVAPRGTKASKGRCRGSVSGVIESGCRWVGDWQPPVLQGEAKLWEVVS